MITNTVPLLQRENDENDIPFGVVLSLVELPIAVQIIQQHSLTDFTIAYSKGQFGINDDMGSIQAELRILNLGEVRADMVNVWLVVWKTDGNTKVIKRGQYYLIEPKSFMNYKDIFTFSELGITDSTELLAVFAVCFDPFFDKIELRLAEFLTYNQNNNFVDAVKINPCRISRKVVSLSLSQNPFVVKGNIITHTFGFIDVILLSVDAGANANFGVLEPDGSFRNIINDLKGQSRYVILTTVSLPANEIVFVLDSTMGKKLSNNSQHCTLSSSSEGILDLKWEDGGDGDYNDYEIRLIHR